jgi:putative ABC transport system permease protein
MSNEKNQPKSILRFLAWFCPASLYESIEGDLLEQFEVDVIEVGEKKASRRLFWNLLTFFRPGILFRNTSLFKFTNLLLLMDMLINYLKITLRSIKRHKTISFINIAGLAVCMSVGLLIIMLIKTQRSYDQFHPHPERTYRVLTHFNDFGLEGWSPIPLAAELANYPFVENTLSILTLSQTQVALSGKQEINIRTAFTENSFFELFGFKLASGDETSALTNPYSSIITEEASKKLFGTADPLGKVIEIKNWGRYMVTGVIANHNEKSHITSEVFISKATLPSLILNQLISFDLDSWHSNFESNTYVLLKSGDDRNLFQYALDQISNRTILKNEKTDEPLSIHFTALGLKEIPPPIFDTTGGINFGMTTVDMLAFSSFGLLFVLLAVFNYTNLTVARAFARAKEVGVRKITGALRIQIATQIFVESILLSFFALVISFFIARFIPISSGLKESIDFTNLDIMLFVYCSAFALFVGFMAGLFPAIILSKIKPLQAIGNLLNTKLFKSLKARNALIVIQFSISLIFLIVVVVLYKQMNLQMTADLGFERKNILTIPLHSTDYKILQAEIERHASITSVSSSSSSPFQWGKSAQVAKNEIDEPLVVNYFSIDPQFLHVWGIPLIGGDNFSEEILPNNEQFVLLNESAVRKLALGSPAEAIGKSILVDSVHLQIAGVVKDFHSTNFRWAISPLILRYRPQEFKQINIKFQPGNQTNVEDHIAKVWNKFEPDFPMTPVRFDEAFEEQQSHRKDSNMVATFSLIAIFVSCLGLFGVVLYSVEVRSKEIAIRKIMGSSVVRLTLFLSRNFFALLLLSLCIGVPIGFLISKEILKTYTYKIDLGIGIALTILGITLCIGLVTICSQTIRAALASPVNALKSD